MGEMAMNATEGAEVLSRRTALIRLGLGSGLGVALATQGLKAGAQDATPAVSSDLPPAIRAFIAAFEAGSADQLAAAYSPDGVLEEVGFGQTFSGRDSIREDEAAFLAGFTEVVIQVGNAFASGDWAALEWSFTGVYSGAIPGMPAGAGQTVTFRGSSILLAGSDGIQRHTQYFDALGILVQLGAMPAPGAEAEASPAA
jgi:steroid delta-isomerase-like uncharacterized protein